MPCDPIPASTSLPISLNGYTISASTLGATVSSDQNGGIPLNGGITISFDREHVGTVLEFLGGSVGDVDPLVTLNATGGAVATSGIAVPKTPGATVRAPMYTRGVTKIDLVSRNNEGTLIAICPED